MDAQDLVPPEPENCPEEDETEEEKLVNIRDHLSDAERRIAFTDAVVAIAMTLLILPLMDSVVDAVDLGKFEWFQENRKLLSSFLISFLVIGTFWRQHDILFAYVGAITYTLGILNQLWMVMIVLMPVSTSISNKLPDSNITQHFVYIGNMLLARVIVGCMALVILKDKRTWKEGRRPSGILLIDACVDIVLFGVALGLSMTRMEYWSLCILFASPYIALSIAKKWPHLCSFHLKPASD